MRKQVTWLIFKWLYYIKMRSRLTWLQDNIRQLQGIWLGWTVYLPLYTSTSHLDLRDKHQVAGLYILPLCVSLVGLTDEYFFSRPIFPGEVHPSCWLPQTLLVCLLGLVEPGFATLTVTHKSFDKECENTQLRSRLTSENEGDFSMYRKRAL